MIDVVGGCVKGVLLVCRKSRWRLKMGIRLYVSKRKKEVLNRVHIDKNINDCPSVESSTTSCSPLWRQQVSILRTRELPRRVVVGPLGDPQKCP